MRLKDIKDKLHGLQNKVDQQEQYLQKLLALLNQDKVQKAIDSLEKHLN